MNRTCRKEGGQGSQIELMWSSLTAGLIPDIHRRIPTETKHGVILEASYFLFLLQILLILSKPRGL